MSDKRIEIFEGENIVVYDIFACRNNTSLCVIGYFGRLGNPETAICTYGAGQSVNAIHYDGVSTSPRKKGKVSILLFPIPENAFSEEQLIITVQTDKKVLFENLEVLVNGDHKKTFLSVSTLFKDENRFLKEWIEYHLLMGVEHFYLYDNNSGDREGILSILEPYKNAGIVTHIPWDYPYNVDPPRDYSWAFCQDGQVNHALYKYGDTTRWMLYIDIDEYIYPSQDPSSIKKLLHKFDHDEIASLRVKCMWFGNSGNESTPEGLVIKNFSRRAEQAVAAGHEKLFARPENIEILNSVHIVRNPKNNAKSVDINPEFLRLNHYYSTGRKDRVNDNLYNDIEDLGMHRFTANIESKM